jgi:hypothetical protein
MSRSTTSARCRFTPRLEALEDRSLLSTTLPGSLLHLPSHAGVLGKLSGNIPPIQFQTTVTVDPGTLPGVTAGLLRFFLSAAVANRTISENRGGDHVKVSNLQITDLKVPPQVSRTTVALAADIKYRKTRGFPQFSVSGHLAFTVQPLLQVTRQGTTLVKAVVLPQNITVTHLSIPHVPSWLANNGKIRDWLSHQLTVNPIDVTFFVQFYLQHGGTLPSSGSL